MQIHLLTRSEAQTLYTERMCADFPPAELKPFSAVEELLRAGLYEPLLLEENGLPAAYAWQVVPPGQGCVLVDYFAVRQDLRGSGFGTRALHALCCHYAARTPALLFECEHPAEAPDPATARRRIGFYLRAGANASAIESRVFGVRYSILSMPCALHPTDAEISHDLQALYRLMVPEPYYRGNVIFYGG